jgi:leucyl/phenylalanyl-tRNA--protein transferase
VRGWIVDPREPPVSEWAFPDPSRTSGDLVALGADLEPGTLLAAYRCGLFPMPIDDRRGRTRLGWFSPERRGILPIDGLRVSRSLRRSCRRYDVRFDEAFDDVIRRCGAEHRPGRWITPEIVAGYTRLHELGWAHSIECYAADRLVGGLYGVHIDGLFAGESMFYDATDASKVALVALVAMAGGLGITLIDVQWQTSHLASLGVVEIPRREYLHRLALAVGRPRDAEPSSG